MKYFVLSLLLLATVSGEQGEDLGEMLDSTTKSIEDTSKTVDSSEAAFEDFLSMFNESTSDSKPKKVDEFKRCAVSTLNTACAPSVVSFLEGLERVLEQFYAPCPAVRHSEDVIIIS